MGERAEIYVIREGDLGIELWCHWCGHKEYFLEFMEGFVDFVRDCVGDQLHWLEYPTDVSAMMIAYSYEEAKKFKKRFTSFYYKPDIRPRGNIWDFSYIWIIELNGKFWHVHGYNILDLDIPEGTMNKIRKFLSRGRVNEALSIEIKEGKTLHDYLFAEKTFEVY